MQRNQSHNLKHLTAYTTYYILTLKYVFVAFLIASRFPPLSHSVCFQTSQQRAHEQQAMDFITKVKHS